MAIRVTQQYVDVFGETSGNLSCGRQYVEVLGEAAAGDIEESASSTISFVSTATSEPLPQSVAQDLGISDAAAYAMTIAASASSTMNLTQQILKTAEVSVNDNMTLTQNVINFNFVADRVTPENTIVFTQVAAAGGFKTVEQDLGLTQSVDVRGPILQIVNHRIFLTDLARNTCHNLRVTQTLAIVDDARVPLPTQHVTDTMNLSDNAYMSFIAQTMNLTQTAVGGRSPGVQTQTITFTQVVVPNGTLRRTIAQDLGIDHALTYFEDSPCNRKNYTPFIGEGSANTPPATLTSPQYSTSPGSTSDRFLLYYPARGARSTTVSIRAPQFGNRDRNAYTRVNRETRGGQLIVYADPTWPQVRTMAVTITGLTKTEVDEVQSLFYNHLGQLIGITDWEGYEWEGVVIDPEQPAVQDGKERWTITFQFEGEIIEGFSPGHDLGVSDTAPHDFDPGANSDLGLTQALGGSWPTPDPPAGQNLGFISTASATVESP